MVGLESFELQGIKSYTRFWGLLMFGSYSVINVIVLLNLLIAMMSNSYAMIEQHSDTEWKFARTRLWMSYFEESSTLPPPFNIFPTMKHLLRIFGKKKKRDIKRESTIVSFCGINNCRKNSPILSKTAPQGGQGAGRALHERYAGAGVALRVGHAPPHGGECRYGGRYQRGQG